MKAINQSHELQFPTWQYRKNLRSNFLWKTEEKRVMAMLQNNKIILLCILNVINYSVTLQQQNIWSFKYNVWIMI